MDWVQLRERERQGRALLALVDAILQATRVGGQRAGSSVQVLVNRRVDVALASGADGVHLGFDGMPPDAARRLLGNDSIKVAAARASMKCFEGLKSKRDNSLEFYKAEKMRLEAQLVDTNEAIERV